MAELASDQPSALEKRLGWSKKFKHSLRLKKKERKNIGRIKERIKSVQHMKNPIAMSLKWQQRKKIIED